MNTIIIAALAILVLIVLAVIFGNKGRDFANNTRSCENLGGECKSECDADLERKHIGKTNCGDVSYCCIRIYDQ